jgi:folate-binding protein YgfZ
MGFAGLQGWGVASHLCTMPIAVLSDRGVVRVAGPDRESFLQGLVSNDVAGMGRGRAVWAALLSPQGKWLHDFFVTADGDSLLLETEALRAVDLAERLRKFRLRAKVEAVPEHGSSVLAGWGGSAMPEGAAPDPRVPDAGWRLVVQGAASGEVDAAAYDLHRLRLGLPDGSKDLEPDRAILIENGFDELGGISWSKGCFMGQELTARTRYRGLVKKRLIPVSITGTAPPAGAALAQDGAEVGTMRSSRGPLGLALLRLEALEKAAPITFGDTVLAPRVPDWMVLPQPKAA